MAVFSAESIVSLFVTILIMVISQANCNDTAQLKAYWGQEGTTFGDGKSCYRECDGTSKLCYFEFEAEHFQSMGAQCGDCEKNVTSDCFNPNCVLANGRPRNILTMNRQIPGPTISVCLNDEVIIDVKNHMSGSVLSIHWHGLHHVSTPWMDGVPMVTQCPILPGNTFRYRFRAEQPGTQYWHAHTGLQRADGLFGRFIVRVPKTDDPNGNLYDFDENQHTIMVTDWTRKMATEYEPGTTIDTLKVSNILINGLGCDTYENETNCDRMPLPTFYMEYDKSYRWRMDNSMSLNCPMEFTMQGHRLTVIASDGFSIQPVTVDAVFSSSGERYDFVVKALSDRRIKEGYLRFRAFGACERDEVQTFARIIYVESHWNYIKSISHARPYPQQLDYRVPFNHDATYLNHPAIKCRSSKHLCVADLEQKGVDARSGQNLRQVVPNREIPLRFSVFLTNRQPSSFLAVRKQSLLGQINNIMMIDPPYPGLTQDDSNVPYCNESTVANLNSSDGFHSCHHLIHLEHNEIVDFLLFDEGNPGAVSHPFHLHGYGFQVIDMGTREQYFSNRTPYYHDTHPPIVKDTVAVPSGGYVRFRLCASNPGYWFFHCHFEWHMHIGMRLIVRVGQKSQMLSPPAGFPTCGNFKPPAFEW